MDTQISHLLRTLRKDANLTCRELGRRAQVPHSLVVGLQTRKRRIGEFQARKIGAALKLMGPQLDDFVFAAINDCTDKVLEESKPYPAELLNYLARLLRIAGVMANSILSCTIGDNEITLNLSTGQAAVLNTHLAIA